MVTNLTIQMPEDLARRLESLAAAELKSVEQIAVERLQSSLDIEAEPRPGSPDDVLRAVGRPPHLSAADVDELDAAIASGRIPIRGSELFPE